MADNAEGDWAKGAVRDVDPHDFIIAQVVVRGGWVRCPFCRVLLDFCPIRCSCLGPSRLECPQCSRVLLSHRKEWADTPWKERGGFVWLSLGYLVVVAV